MACRRSRLGTRWNSLKPLDFGAAKYEVVAFQEVKRHVRTSDWAEKQGRNMVQSYHPAEQISEEENPETSKKAEAGKVG